MSLWLPPPKQIVRSPSLVGDGALFFGGVSTPSWMNLHSADLDGISDFISYGNNYDMVAPIALTAWAFVYMTSVMSAVIFHKYDTALTNAGYTLEINLAGKLVVVVAGSIADAIIIRTQEALLANQWYFVVWKWDGTDANGMSILINDVAATIDILANNLVLSPSTSEDFRIGVDLGSSRWYFPGQIDEAGIAFGTELSAANTTAMYGSGGHGSDMSGILGVSSLWRFENNFLDSVGVVNGTNHGALFSTNVP